MEEKIGDHIQEKAQVAGSFCELVGVNLLAGLHYRLQFRAHAADKAPVSNYRIEFNAAERA